MGTQFVDGSPSLGSIFSNMAGAFEAAPGKALDNIAKAEAIKTARIAREREAEQYGLTQGLLGTVEGAVPVAQAKPTTTVGPYTGTLADAQGLPTATFVDPRMQAAAEARRAAAVAGTKATLFKDPSQWAPQLAQSEVASTGVPERQDERSRIQFATTGRFPTAEETKTPNAQNFAIINADGSATGQGFSSLNGGKTAIDGTQIELKPGQRIMETGPAPLQVGNPLENQAKALERLNVLRREIDPAKGPTPEQALQVQQLVDVAYKPVRKIEKIGERDVVVAVPDNPVPPWVTAMMPRAPVTSSVSTTAPAPVAASEFTARDIADPAKLDAPLAPQPVAPLVSDPNAARIVEERPGSSVELRKEFQNTPAYKKYTGSISDYNNVVKAATEGEPNNTTDLNIIYSIAKIFDPDSAVKDGELKLPNATGSLPQQLSSLYSRLINDKGMMSTETRANLVAEATRRVNEYKESMNVTNTQFTDLAKRIGVPPEAVIVQVPPMVPYDKEAAMRAGGATPAQVNQRSPTAPRPPERPNF